MHRGMRRYISCRFSRLVTYRHALTCEFLRCLTAIPTGLSHGALYFLQLRIEQTVRHEAGSAVPGCFLRELYAGGEAEFGVDVGEVGLHGAG